MKTATIILIAGMVIAFIGSIVTARAVIVKPETAGELAVSRWAYSTPAENAKLPFAQALLAQSVAAKRGLYAIAVGTLLQIIGTVIDSL